MVFNRFKWFSMRFSMCFQLGEFDLIIFARMSAYEPCNFYAPLGDRPNAVPEYYMDVRLSLGSQSDCVRKMFESPGSFA